MRSVYADHQHQHTRGMSKLSSDRLNFARKGHETVARAHSYFANIPEGVRHVLTLNLLAPTTVGARSNP